MAAPRFRWFGRLRSSTGHLFQPLAAVFARGIEVVAKFAFQIVVARSLGSAEAGLFLLALSVASLVQSAAKLSIDRAIIPYIARSLQAEDRDRAFAQIVAAIATIFVVALAVGIVIFAAATPLADLLFRKPEFAAPLRWTAMAIVALCTLNGIVGGLTGIGAAAIGDVLRNSLWPSACLLLLLLVSTATAATGALTASILLAVFAAGWTLRRRLPARWPRLRDLALPPGLIAMAWPICVSDTIDVVLITLPTLVLGAVGTSREVGIFSVANRIALIFIALVGAIGNAASPRLALISAETGGDRLGRTMRDVALLAMASCAPLAAVLLLAPRWIMGVFGADYVEGAQTLRVLVAGSLVFVAFSCCSELLAMSGHGRLLQRVKIITLCLCLVASVTVIPIFGAMGAAVVTAVTVAISGLLAGLAVRRRLGLPAIPLLAGGGLFAPRKQGAL